jgi:hypothetical protein
MAPDIPEKPKTLELKFLNFSKNFAEVFYSNM